MNPVADVSMQDGKVLRSVSMMHRASLATTTAYLLQLSR